MLYFLQQLLNGLHSAALYALLAFGYVLINCMVKRTNLAHGPVFAFAGQTLILIAVFGWNVLWLTLPAAVALGVFAAFAYSALVATILSRSVFLPLAKSGSNAIVVATLGVALALMELARIVSDTRDFWLAPILATPIIFWSGGGFQVTLTVMQVANCALAVAAIGTGAFFLSHFAAGRNWRAVSDDALASALCGVDTARVFRGSVLAGSIFAALAGVMAALYYGNVSFGTGMTFGLKVLFVTAAGSYRDPMRAAVGAALFGVAESLWAGYFPIEWRDAWMFGLLVALLVLTRAGRDDAATVRL